ncbi:MAG: hypothetical protein WC597_04610 [Brevundimonas sp.]
MTHIRRIAGSKMAIFSLLASSLTAEPAVARQNNATAGSDLIGTVTRCREIEANVARLSCFDTAAAGLAAAGEVAVVSRQDVEQNQRRLFGFNISTLNPFENSGRSESLQSISATITSARNLGRGEWLITLDDSSVWRKTDGADVSFLPNRQYPVTVRRAAMGSYMMKVANDPPFRVRRE